MDRDHRVAEPVQFRLGLALGRFDHEGPRDREGKGRRVKAVIDQTLRDILGFEAVPFLHSLRSMMHSWATSPAGPRKSTGKRPIEPLGDVVGVEDRRPGSPR